MEKVLVFIDGGFLSKVGIHFGRGIPVKYNILRFTKLITGKENLIFKQERYDKFIENLKKEGEITVREGRCQRIRADGKFVYAQKGVDTLLTMDLMEVRIKHEKVNKIILIASDSDFVPVINRLRSYGIEVILYTYFDKKRNSIFSTSNRILSAVNRYVQLTHNEFENSK